MIMMMFRLFFFLNLAIHLSTADERKAFQVNTESHLQPILTITDPICPPADGDKEKEKNRSHDAQLLDLIAHYLSCGVDDISDIL